MHKLRYNRQVWTIETQKQGVTVLFVGKLATDLV